MVGIGNPAVIGAARAASTGLIGAIAEGGAGVVAGRGRGARDDDLPDPAALESGTDGPSTTGPIPAALPPSAEPFHGWRGDGPANAAIGYFAAMLLSLSGQMSSRGSRVRR